ncbi:unnamed protein product [Caenorhabditis auriculariae]|uniref:Uncharacterized protein n=1 Tax=Caenorhabditis auriculariae TaxID=2777116 RepID=A0A8S1H5T3_9PELO|nr:unnamed protein product [Caenorhabditis auriculariae]
MMHENVGFRSACVFIFGSLCPQTYVAFLSMAVHLVWLGTGRFFINHIFLRLFPHVAAWWTVSSFVYVIVCRAAIVGKLVVPQEWTPKPLIVWALLVPSALYTNVWMIWSFLEGSWITANGFKRFSDGTELLITIALNNIVLVLAFLRLLIDTFDLNVPWLTRICMNVREQYKCQCFHGNEFSPQLTKTLAEMREEAKQMKADKATWLTSIEHVNRVLIAYEAESERLVELDVDRYIAQKLVQRRLENNMTA